MRESVFTIRDGLTRGLRPDKRMLRSAQMLIQCRGLEPGPGGLSAIEPLAAPLAGFPAAWPLPTLMRGERETLLGGTTGLYTVDETQWLWSPLETIDAATGEPRAIVAGGPWQIADFGSSWMATNGRSVVWRRGGAVYAQDSIPVNAAAAYKSRSVIGGFDGGTFWSAEWQAWLAAKNVNSGVDASLETGAATVLWSAIGAGNMDWPFNFGREMTGPVTGAGFDSTRPLWIEEMFGGDVGWLALPWQGTVYALRRLGDKLIAYGDGGIAVLFAVLDPAPTLGMKQLADFGIAGRAAVGGDERRHVFMDGAGTLWQLDADLKLVKLDYREHFVSMDLAGMVVSYDSHADRHFIADGETGFVLTGNGLVETARRPSSIVARPEGPVALEAGAADSTFEIKTDLFDLGYRGIKMISTVEIGGQDLSGVEVAVDFQSSAGPWMPSPWRPLNSQSWAMVSTAGVDFKLKLRGTAGSDARLEYVNVRWKAIDNRGIRSPLTEN